MRKSIIRVASYSLLIGLAISFLMVFLPRTYSVPAMQRWADTQYWQLPTDSRIAFTRIAAKAKKKPYPIIYLHGGPGGHVRNKLIESLAPLAQQGYDLYFYDQIGSGLSDRLSDITEYTVERHIRALEAITEKLGVGKVILIGQSWGAILATLFMERFPQKTHRLVLTYPGPIFPVRAELTKLPAPDSFDLKRPIFTNAEGNKKASNIRSKVMHFFAFSFGWRLASDTEADRFAAYGGYYVNRSAICDTANIPSMEAGSGFYAGVRTFKSLLEIKDYRSTLKRLKITCIGPERPVRQPALGLYQRIHGCI